MKQNRDDVVNFELFEKINYLATPWPIPSDAPFIFRQFQKEIPESISRWLDEVRFTWLVNKCDEWAFFASFNKIFRVYYKVEGVLWPERFLNKS